MKDQLDCASEMMKSYADPGVMMDCIVFHDGEKWRAAIDFAGSGDLTNATLLTNYRDELQYVCMSQESMLNVSVNIYDEGEMLSIVSTAGSHGTHVAAICAAYHPDQIELNGVAPGAQIVSLKIGDTRLGSMETCTGLVRAAIELARLKVDLANISYGEAAAIPNFGRFMEIIHKDVINKNGCIVVSSAGNNGPALTTVGSPGGVSSHMIGVGAFVSHSMMDAEYGMLKNVREQPYTWSSRGPTPDGDAGVDIYAPGAAITSVPQYTIQSSQLMNGTSMSSPNCCGCLSLLLSGLKARGDQYTPYHIKRAIQLTSKSINDPMQVGLIQVERAWQYLTEDSKGVMAHSLHYYISIPSRNKARGIYLRDLCDTNSLQEMSVQVDPLFFKNDDPKQNADKVEFEMHLNLRSDKQWIQTPEFLVLNNAGRAFPVLVDPTNLSPGLHVASIDAYDCSQKQLGPVFKIPITVCKPDIPASSTESSCYQKYEHLHFTPGDIKRRFVHVPLGSNFVELAVCGEDRPTEAKFIVNLLQLHPQSRYTTFEHEKSFSLTSTESDGEREGKVFRKFRFPVLSNVTMEVCMAQYWSSLENSTVSIELKFHGIFASVSSIANGTVGVTGGPGASELLLNTASHGLARIDVSAPCRAELISPKISLGIDFFNLDTLRKVLRPSKDILQPLKTRDVLPDTRQVHELILTYEFKVNEACTVYPRFPRFNDTLYDSCLDGFGFHCIFFLN